MLHQKVRHYPVSQILEQLLVLCKDIIDLVGDIGADFDQFNAFQPCLVLLDVVLLVEFREDVDQRLDAGVVDHPDHPAVVDLE